MVRMTSSRIRQRRATGQVPPPVPSENINKEKKERLKKVKNLMANHIRIRRNSPNLLPNNNKSNVATFYNNSFSNTESKNIPTNKRVYISKDLVNGKIKHVYNQDGIIKLLLRSTNFTGKSPISRKNFNIKHVIPYT